MTPESQLPEDTGMNTATPPADQLEAGGEFQLPATTPDVRDETPTKEIQMPYTRPEAPVAVNEAITEPIVITSDLIPGPLPKRQPTQSQESPWNKEVGPATVTSPSPDALKAQREVVQAAADAVKQSAMPPESEQREE